MCFLRYLAPCLMASLLTPACALSAEVDPGGQAVESHTLRIGDAVVVARVTHRPGAVRTYMNLHENESTSVEAALAVLGGEGGTLFQLQHTGERRISFRVEGGSFSVDPNRIFTPRGARLTVESDPPASQEATAAAAKETVRFGRRVLELAGVDKADLVIALHNNTEASYGMPSYLPGGDEESAAAEVRRQRTEDPDDFFFITAAPLFEALSDSPYNAVLQDNSEAADDGSLSVYCGRQGIAYVNVEAQHGHFAKQVAMLRALSEAIDACRLKTPNETGL
ncbi:hypothetical protein Mal64_21220 [Pseudobythopirellula maris]|uniref:N-acetylmuramoyl-L-alanine amidase n=1 Tax=Pseudobythopirellula maris TaxID=2527991 RepID=A0A5C5ZNE1_9BACT|nr:hypothetical protein [Pseudobythopirellula maris]TWT88636.1 hypothetical protein Mal64_21220 [Pseudobythopirellula maris]